MLWDAWNNSASYESSFMKMIPNTPSLSLSLSLTHTHSKFVWRWICFSNIPNFLSIHQISHCYLLCLTGTHTVRGQATHNTHTEENTPKTFTHWTHIYNIHTTRRVLDYYIRRKFKKSRITRASKVILDAVCFCSHILQTSNSWKCDWKCNFPMIRSVRLGRSVIWKLVQLKGSGQYFPNSLYCVCNSIEEEVNSCRLSIKNV